jgi:hypothetical protein
MHTITVQINNNNALKTLRSLEDKQLISIIDDSEIDSPAIPGAALSLSAFKDWVQGAEKGATVSLTEAKERWAFRRKQLQKLIQ